MKRWALIPRLVPVESDNDDKPVAEAANEQLKAQVEKEQAELLVRLNALETRSLGRG